MSPDERPNAGVRDLTTVAQDYLKIIWTTQEWSHEKVSTKLLAERLGVSASTASESIRKLAEQGLVGHRVAVLVDERERAADLDFGLGIQGVEQGRGPLLDIGVGAKAERGGDGEPGGGIEPEAALAMAGRHGVSPKRVFQRGLRGGAPRCQKHRARLLNRMVR